MSRAKAKPKAPDPLIAELQQDRQRLEFLMSTFGEGKDFGELRERIDREILCTTTPST